MKSRNLIGSELTWCSIWRYTQNVCNRRTFIRSFCRACMLVNRQNRAMNEHVHEHKVNVEWKENIDNDLWKILIRSSTEISFFENFCSSLTFVFVAVFFVYFLDEQFFARTSLLMTGSVILRMDVDAQWNRTNQLSKSVKNITNRFCFLSNEVMSDSFSIISRVLQLFALTQKVKYVHSDESVSIRRINEQISFSFSHLDWKEFRDEFVVMQSVRNEQLNVGSSFVWPKCWINCLTCSSAE